MGRGVLTKVPWDQYDSLTLGSFTDWKPRYEAADPVFFWFQADIDLPFVHPGPAQQAGMMEMKLPRATWRDTLPGLGLDVLNVFHDRFVDPVWAALALAAPTALPVDPRSSISFLMPAGGQQHIELSGAEFEGVRVQGDADQELVFLADATSTPLTDVALARTAELCELTERVFTDEPDSSGLMRRLLGVNEITLAPHERSLLAVTDLEDLLLPEVVDAPGDTLARRVANLLGGDRRAPHRVARHCSERVPPEELRSARQRGRGGPSWRPATGGGGTAAGGRGAGAGTDRCRW